MLFCVLLGCAHIYMTGEIPYVSYMHHSETKILNKTVLCPPLRPLRKATSLQLRPSTFKHRSL